MESRLKARGFTLVELMVAIVIGMILTVAVMLTQLNLGTQNMRVADVAARDNESRAAMDSISRDISSGGFLLSGVPARCDVMLAYNAATNAKYINSFPTYGLSGGAAISLPFVDPSGPSGGVAVNYPPGGSVNRSDILVVNATASGTAMANATYPSVKGNQLAITYTPLTSGQIPLTAVTTGGNTTISTLKTGDVGMLQVPFGTLQQAACIRIPITSLATAGGTAYVGSTGALMPTAFYNGFSTQLATVGLATTALTNQYLRAPTTLLTDLGTAAGSTQITYAYFVEQNAAVAPWPRLVRVSINPLNDQVIANSKTDIAAGVVSLQLVFGVDPANTGAVTAYQTSATVSANKYWPFVRSVKIALITRALYPDQNASFTNPANAGKVSTLFNEAGFTDYTISAAESKYRFFAQETELAIRNTLWNPNK